MSSSPSLKCLWGDLLQSFNEGLNNAITELKELDKDKKNIETIRDGENSDNDALNLLLKRLSAMRDNFSQNKGEIFKLAIDDIIQNAFFPDTNNFAKSFEKILLSRTHEQDFIINELINGFIASKLKTIASFSKGPIIDRMVEAFSTRSDFHIVDHQFYAMFGDPNKPQAYIKNNLQELINLFGLVDTQLVVDKDVRSSEKKVYTFYTFPNDILDILKKKYLIIDPHNGNLSVSEAFDRNVFICLFLANIAVNRNNFNQIGGEYTVNGISGVFSLIFFLSYMPNVPAPTAIATHPTFQNLNVPINVIPKSWMMKKVLEFIFEPLIKIIAYRLGSTPWCEAIIDTEINKQIHTQIRFLIKDVNKWILGELCRVEIPIFVEILNVIQVTLQARQAQNKGSTP